MRLLCGLVVAVILTQITNICQSLVWARDYIISREMITLLHVDHVLVSLLPI